jgi:hypothetical protein
VSAAAGGLGPDQPATGSDITTPKSGGKQKIGVDQKIIIRHDAHMNKLNVWIKQERGRLSRLAEYVGVDPSTLCQWQKVPPRHALKVEKFTGISRHDLRPDVYGPKPRASA